MSDAVDVVGWAMQLAKQLRNMVLLDAEWLTYRQVTYLPVSGQEAKLTTVGNRI